MRMSSRIKRVCVAVGALLAVVATPFVAQAGIDPLSAERTRLIEAHTNSENATPAALPTCDAITNHEFWVDGKVFYFRLPSRGRETYAIDCKLQLGDYDNWAVGALQQWLRNCNNAPQVAVDGDYGPTTRAVVAYIQGVNKLEVDGVYGPKTRRVLSWAVYNGSGNFSGCAAP